MHPHLFNKAAMSDSDGEDLKVRFIFVFAFVACALYPCLCLCPHVFSRRLVVVRVLFHPLTCCDLCLVLPFVLSCFVPPPPLPPVNAYRFTRPRRERSRSKWRANGRLALTLTLTPPEMSMGKTREMNALVDEAKQDKTQTR
jgi:hypothetical protein